MSELLLWAWRVVRMDNGADYRGGQLRQGAASLGFAAEGLPSALPRARREPRLMSGGLDVPRRTCHPARHLASTATEEGIRRTQQQSVPPQVPQVGHAGGETGRRASIRRPMLVASVADAKMGQFVRRGILHIVQI